MGHSYIAVIGYGYIVSLRKLAQKLGHCTANEDEPQVPIDIGLICEFMERTFPEFAFYPDLKDPEDCQDGFMCLRSRRWHATDVGRGACGWAEKLDVSLAEQDKIELEKFKQFMGAGESGAYMYCCEE